MTAEFDSAINTIQSQYASLQAGLDTANGIIEEDGQTITLLNDRVAAQEVTLGLNRQEIADLRAQLAECQAQEQTTTFGVYATPGNRDSLEELETAWGIPEGTVKVTRTFSGRTSNPSVAWRPGTAVIASIHHRKMSDQPPSTWPKYTRVLDGEFDVPLTLYAGKVGDWMRANPGEVVIYSYIAEPDRQLNSPMGTPAEYVESYLRVRSIFEDAGVDVPWALILTDWTFNPASGRNPEDYYSPTFEYLGTDPYNFTVANWHDLNITAAEDFAELQGMKLIVPEFGCCDDPNDPERRAQWIRNATEHFREMGVEYATYFNSVGNDVGNVDCRLTGPAIEAYKELL